MTYQEYLNQEDPKKQPPFSVSITTEEGNYFRYGKSEYCQLGDHTYWVEDHVFYTTDDQGNKSRASVFKRGV